MAVSTPIPPVSFAQWGLHPALHCCPFCWSHCKGEAVPSFCLCSSPSPACLCCLHGYACLQMFLRHVSDMPVCVLSRESFIVQLVLTSRGGTWRSSQTTVLLMSLHSCSFRVELANQGLPLGRQVIKRDTNNRYT